MVPVSGYYEMLNRKPKSSTIMLLFETVLLKLWKTCLK